MMNKNTTSSSSFNETSYHKFSSSNSTQATSSTQKPDAPPAGITSTSPPLPPPPLDASLAGNPTRTSGSNQINKPDASSNNHILLALLTVSILVLAIFAIITTWCYLRKKMNMKKKTGETIPTSTGGNIQELPFRYFGEFDQSPVHDMISEPPRVNGVTIERFLSKVENDKPTKFSSQQLARVTGDFTTKLGSGGFGDVYKGKLADGVLVAVKRLKDNKSAKKIQEQFMAEVGTIGNTYHINLVRLHGYCIEPTMTALVYEYMENGSLDRFLFGGNRTIDWRKLHEIAIGTAKGIAYLHEECQPRIIHYDIKPGNILLDAKLIPKVADFGLAKLCRIGSSHVTLEGGRGTPVYAAPELWKPWCPTTYKCDVYSFGIVLFEIVGRRRNHDTTVSELTRELLSSWTWEMFKKNRLFELVSICGIEEKDKAKAENMLVVALLCIHHLPERRPVMSDVVKMLEGGMEVPTPSYPFEHTEPYDPVESARGSKDRSIPIRRLGKSKTLICKSFTPAASFPINL